MKTSRAAIRYAKALLLEAVDKNSLEETFNDMKLVKITFANNIELKHMVESRVIKNSIKLSSLNLIFKQLGALSLSLINVLYENNRMNILDIVALKYIERYKDFKGIQSATVTTAVPLNKELENQILETTSKLTNKKMTLINKVDKSLVGGFVLRVGDIEYNASFKNKLKNIKQEFNKNTNLSIS
jgi:F-type H+-transporting ATPase subunit delta|tara:strand:+ start:1209 stop:1763 length:555 start_codon:yes stop_codon:yes gene_type:complete